jgi:hypothetical protein
MAIQQYFVVENNVVTNNIIWDGDTNIWQPPTNATMLVQATTPAMVWVYQPTTKTFVLTEVVGAGDIGFTWNDSVLTTNLPKPAVPTQPVSTGTQTA